jgi:hypothetical protein
MEEEKEKLVYEKVDRVGRWNFCQLLAKHIYESGISNAELERIVLEIENINRKLILQIK